MKLVRVEKDSDALRAALAGQNLASCQLVLTELYRAVGRYADVEARRRVDQLLDSVAIVTLNRSLLMTAGQLPPPQLRSLDAIHVAAAMIFAGLVVGLVTYNQSMAEAAVLHGFEVWAPHSQP